MKSGNLNFLELSGPLQTCDGTDLPFTFYRFILVAWQTYNDNTSFSSNNHVRANIMFILRYIAQEYNILRNIQ